MKNQVKWVKVGLPEALLEEMREKAKSNNTRIWKVAKSYFEEIVRQKKRFEQPIEVTVCVRDFDLSQLKDLAAKSNMTVTKYVETFYKTNNE